MKVFLCLLLLFTGWSFGQSKDEPSLADLSKQARERKANTAKPAKLITNADLQKYQNAPVSISRGAATEQTDEEKKGKDGNNSEGAEGKGQPEAKEKDAEFWRTAFGEARMNYKNAVNKGLVLQLRLNNLMNMYYREDDGSTKAMFQQQMETTRQDIEKNKTEVEQANDAISKLEREAADAGMEASAITEMIGELPDPTTIEEVSNPTPQQ